MSNAIEKLEVYATAGVRYIWVIDPRRKKYVLIKSRQHFRAGFEPIAKHIVMCDGDGCTASDLKLFKYTRVKRPLYPFDLDMRLGRNEA